MSSEPNYSLVNGSTFTTLALPWKMNFWTLQTPQIGDG